ncbi:hypothetical protein ACP70R_027904 [Stipagrostis hirtigluma subsp. patula]
MENLEQIQQTLSDVDDRVPDAFRIALGLGNRVSPTPAPGEDDDVANFAASLLEPVAAGGGGDGRTAELDDVAPTASLRIDIGSCYIPLDDHDAHFVDASAGVFGVADGVGQYNTGAFARGLMANASAEVAAAEPGAPVCPYALLENAYDKTVASRPPGASTAVILSLAGKSLSWAYLGDSAFAVLRGGKIVHLSWPQQHLKRGSLQKLRYASSPARKEEIRFTLNDPPFQLCCDEARSDSVADARRGSEEVMAGDVVVAGTDELFGNMLNEQLERAVQLGTRLGFSPKNMADVIAGVAYERSKQPYVKRLRRGKPDDITVVVAFVVQSDS